MADVLLYYIEAFLPFLNAYYAEAYQKDHEKDDEMKNSIYTALLVGWYLIT